MVKHTIVRSAFTMIELIFAIVVIAIAVVSLPMMVQTVSKGIEGNIVQEAIFAGSAQLNEATTYAWDESSVEDLNISELARAVNTNHLDCPRLGFIQRKCLTNLNTRPLDASVVNGSSIDSIVYTNQPVFLGTLDATTYKTDYRRNLSVTRCIAGNTFVPLNQAESTNHNVKQIEYKTKDVTNSKTIVILRAYTANIGEVIPEVKTL